MKTKKLGGRWSRCGRDMAAWKRSSEVKDEHGTSRKPSTVFWREDCINRPRIEIKRKKDTSGLLLRGLLNDFTPQLEMLTDLCMTSATPFPINPTTTIPTLLF